MKVIALCRLSPQLYATQTRTLLMAMVSVQLVDSFEHHSVAATHHNALSQIATALQQSLMLLRICIADALHQWCMEDFLEKFWSSRGLA